MVGFLKLGVQRPLRTCVQDLSHEWPSSSKICAVFVSQASKTW
jgi:hypothetical protein